MEKTPTQGKLEAERGKDIRQILIDCLESRRGQRNKINKIAIDLDVTAPTIYRWCEEIGIDIEEYRCPPGQLAAKP